MQVEREILNRVLKETQGNKAQAARLLRIDYKTIHKKVREYGLSCADGGRDIEVRKVFR